MMDVVVRDREARDHVITGKSGRPNTARNSARRVSKSSAINRTGGDGGRYSARLRRTQVK